MTIIEIPKGATINHYVEDERGGATMTLSKTRDSFEYDIIGYEPEYIEKYKAI